ncbi:hypothetical protein C8R46DRAFT_276074 [Mycena filopes]|nr:hypothetical protein C8R46DRAFT_276074 [Mycena filopes]
MNLSRPHQPYFRSPTVSESSALAADRGHIARLDAQIIEHALSHASRDLSLYRLKRERREALKRLDAYIYPVLTLPNEIISEIFVNFLPGYPQRPPAKGTYSPLKLGQICYGWREIAWSTPSLWRAVAFKLPPGSCRILVEEWLARAASLPLSISLAYYYASPEFGIFDAITRHSVRWEHVELYSMQQCAAEWLSRLLREPLPMLQSLDITIPNRDGPLLTAFAASPRLRTLSTCDFSPSLILLPLTQLTTLIMICERDTIVAETLDQTTNLVHFEADLKVGWDAPRSRPVKALQFLQFMRLAIDWSDGDDSHLEEGCNFIDRLTLPALRTLHVEQAFLGDDFVTPLSALLSRSGCTIQTLRVLNCAPWSFDGEVTLCRDWGCSRAWLQQRFPTIQTTLAWISVGSHDHLDPTYEHLDREWDGEDDSTSSNSSDEDLAESDEELE